MGSPCTVHGVRLVSGGSARWTASRSGSSGRHSRNTFSLRPLRSFRDTLSRPFSSSSTRARRTLVSCIPVCCAMMGIEIAASGRCQPSVLRATQSIRRSWVSVRSRIASKRQCGSGVQPFLGMTIVFDKYPSSLSRQRQARRILRYTCRTHELRCFLVHFCSC